MEVHGEIRSLLEISLVLNPNLQAVKIFCTMTSTGTIPKTDAVIEEEIVYFADIGEFIDYPVKTYSPGMQVRLAFAISTAIPEIFYCLMK